MTVPTSEEQVKTLAQDRYTQKTGEHKDNPPANLTRAICLSFACSAIKQYLQKMINDESVENCMEYSPYVTAQVTDKQYICRANPYDLVLIGNPADLSDMIAGGQGLGPHGNLNFSLQDVINMGVEIIPLYGM